MRNKTLHVDQDEIRVWRRSVCTLDSLAAQPSLLDKTVCGDAISVIPLFDENYFDLIIVDPPYNINKKFGKRNFVKKSDQEYKEWLERYISLLPRVMKSTASIYVCCDWSISSLVEAILKKYFQVRNRITWEREKGRGAYQNWKNCSEDIWFCTKSEQYHFDVDAVKLRRKVIAPYRLNGQARDWQEDVNGKFRLTAPSNLWTDITVPFWSMPENTDHPTQKPEKLMAKLILASSQPNDIILDPFLGSGTTSVVAKKLGRHYVGIEIEEDYCCLAEKRLSRVEINGRIQGYESGVFFERNTSFHKEKLSSTSHMTQTVDDRQSLLWKDNLHEIK